MVNFDADCGNGIVNLKSFDVSGVYILERYWVGGWAVAGIIDSKGTERDFFTATPAFVPIVTDEAEGLVPERDE